MVKNQYGNIIINGLYATLTSVAVGAGTSELTKLLTDNTTTISVTSTVAGYTASWIAFLGLQARKEKEHYQTPQNTFDTRQFIKDYLKFGIGLAALDVAYIATRPFVQEHFMNEGMKPATSSLAADGLFVPAYVAVSLGLAKMSGIIKKQKNQH